VGGRGLGVPPAGALAAEQEEAVTWREALDVSEKGKVPGNAAKIARQRSEFVGIFICTNGFIWATHR
jgi:hypothetical protein